jgi:hypothetical protein
VAVEIGVVAVIQPVAFRDCRHGRRRRRRTSPSAPVAAMAGERQRVDGAEGRWRRAVRRGLASAPKITPIMRRIVSV